MTIIKSVTILDKLIEKTKNNSIHWKKYSDSDIELKQLPPSPLNTSLETAMSIPFESQLNSNDSYICSFNDGVFALLLYNDLFRNELYLRIQTTNSQYSKNYASTLSTDDVNESAKLKRLYNLVDSLAASVDIDNFVEDFLTNE